MTSQVVNLTLCGLPQVPLTSILVGSRDRNRTYTLLELMAYETIEASPPAFIPAIIFLNIKAETIPFNARSFVGLLVPFLSRFFWNLF